MAESSLCRYGGVDPCGVDFKSTPAIGSVKEKPMTDLRRSPAYMKLREDHLAHKRSARSPCSRCAVV